MRAVLLLSLLLFQPVLHANESMKLDEAPIDTRNAVSLQRGAQVFVNYCLNCHSATGMRYNRLGDLGLTPEQIKDNLMFASDKPGAPMTIAMRPADAKDWFGVAPPDLSVVARSRGADWLYTYLRGFYRDDSTATGWNNLVFPNVLWELQGQQALKMQDTKGEHGTEHVRTLTIATPGTMSGRAYDTLAAD